MKIRTSPPKIRILLLFTLLCAAMASLQIVQAATITVTSTADSGQNTLRAALASATDGDTINFSLTYPATVTLTSGQLVVDKNVMISGPGADQLTVQRSTAGGTPNFRIFHISSGKTVTISGLTITNGNDYGGGGIYNDHATLTVDSCTLSGNSANNNGGGGISNDGSPGSATLTITNSTLSGNNSTGFGGGGILNYGISGNATLTITNSTVSGNSGGTGGGGVFNDGYQGNATLTITNSTLSGNSVEAGGYGGGIFNYGISGSATVTIGNAILKTGSSGENIVSGNGTVNSLGHNFSSDAAGGDGTNVPGGFLNHTGDIRNTDPMLGPLQNNGGPTFTHALLTGSPAIDAGDPNFTSPPFSDQRGAGFNRVSNNRIDIGAFEVQVTITVTVTNTNDSGVGSLRAALASGDTINFALTYPATILLTSGELVVDRSVNIIGTGADQLSVNGNFANSGNPNSTVFHVQGGVAASISGLTITNGHNINKGGGIYNDHSTLTVSNCTIGGNSAQAGGGINNDGTFGTATLTINNSTLSGNSTGASGGGGIFNDGAFGSTTLTVNNSTISGNSAGDFGGGAGIYNHGYQGSATLTINNCTVTGNSAGQAGGGGIYNNNIGASGRATVTIRDTILKTGASGGNVFNDSGTVTSLGYNLSSDAAGGDGTTGPGGFLNATGDIRNTDPLLGPLQDNGGPTFTHGLLVSSPAINMGDPNFSPPPDYDQRGPGYPRVMNGRIEIGAFEMQATPSPTPTATPSPSPTPTPTPTPAATATPTATATFTPTPTPTPSPTPEATNLAVTAATGIYGGTVTLSATLTSLGSPVSGKMITFTLNGNPAGTGVTDGTGIASVTNVSLSGTNAGTYPLGVAASFAGDGSYSGSNGAAALMITPRGLTVTATGFDKVYDGTTAAMVTLSDDRIAGDSLAVAYAAASFADKNAGTGKPVSVVGISIGGDDAGNYNLLNTTANTTANITLRSLLITAQNQSKTYGATFTFAGTEFDVSAGGLATGDSVTSVTLSSAGAAVTAPAGTHPIMPSAAVGSGLSNYAIGYADGSFTVFQSPTSIVYTGFTSGTYLDTKQASAIVSSATVPPVGTSVHFSLVPFGGGLELQGCTGTIDASGFASCSLQLVQPSGNYSLVATALGNDNFSASSATATITIFVPDTNLAVTAATGTYGGMVTLSATLTSSGSPVSGKTITFVLNGTNGGTGVTDGTGVATVTNVSLSGINAGTYPLGVLASFAGDAFYTATTGTAALTVNPAYAAQIQQPVNADGSSVFNVRRGVIPVKFTLTLNGVATCNLPPATIAVYRTGTGGNQLIDESVYEGSADTGSNFRITGCQYIYNLSASALGVGTYRVDIKINNQVVGSATFQLK